QAEDGIRDGHVTGVQTCALPIWDLLAEDPDRAGAVAEEAPERARRLVADEEDDRARVGEPPLEMVENPAAGGHPAARDHDDRARSEEHTSELQSRGHLVCRLLLE